MTPEICNRVIKMNEQFYFFFIFNEHKNRNVFIKVYSTYTPENGAPRKSFSVSIYSTKINRLNVLRLKKNYSQNGFASLDEKCGAVAVYHLLL